MADDGDIRVRVRVTGRVQGVYFRQSTAREAAAIGVGGWVRNLDDGSVEAAFEGSPERVGRMLTFARTGPLRAQVDDVEETLEAPEGVADFRVL